MTARVGAGAGGAVMLKCTHCEYETNDAARLNAVCDVCEDGVLVRWDDAERHKAEEWAEGMAGYMAESRMDMRREEERGL